MTKCLLKALKAVNLENHLELFRSFGYDSAGALAHFHHEHFKQLNLSPDELLRFHSLLDVLKEATREGKICPHYSKSTKQTSIRAKSTEPPNNHRRNSQSNRTNNQHSKKRSNENLKSKRSSSSIGINGRLSSLSGNVKSHANGFILQKPSTGVIRQQTNHEQQFFGPKSFFNRPPVEHVKVKSYNYGVPTTKRPQTSTQRVHYQHETNSHHPSIFVSSSQNQGDLMSYAKPAEIYVYARKRPLLTNEMKFQDTISVLDSKHIVLAENKSNLDCTPLLKKSEFQFDQVFSADASNRQVFECTVLPFLSSNTRQNLTYICFGQTGSGKSHTIFGSRNTDGLLIHCAQLFLQEINLQTKLFCSFYEIYNNQVYDLSNTGKRLFVREDGDHHVNIVGLNEILLKNLDTLRSIIYDGLSRRHHGKSAFNSNSSRSHAIFQLNLKNFSNQNQSNRLIFIDLAGSERAIDAQNNLKQTRREGAQINTSLLALKECIRSMDLIHTHAPFRQSKLTHILRDSLVGNQTRTCLMANISPAEDCCQCSLNTLQYAARIRDISIRHRHRSLSMTNFQRNHFDNDQQTIVKDKQQKTFKPATASTPVHRIDHRNHSEQNWQLVDDDVPISGSGENVRIQSVLSTTREFRINSNNQNQSASFYLTRYEQPRRKDLDQEENTSSYFPPPQIDMKKSSPISQQCLAVPLPPSARRLSESSIEPSSSTRIIPIVSLPMSDDNQYSSATGTESLGTKITKLATGTNMKIENLNFNKTTDAITTTTTDTEQGFYSDRQATHRDQTGFFSNRDDPLYENNYKSGNLTTITQQTSPIATPKTSSHSKSDVLSNSSKKSFSSPNKIRHRHLEPSSSSSSLTSIDSTKNSRRHHRFDVKYRPQKSSSTRNESSQTMTNSSAKQTDYDQTTDDQLLLEQFADYSSTNLLHAPLDQIKHFYDQTTSSLSPTKDDLSIHVSNQLNTLRTLLERRLVEQDDIPITKDFSCSKSSPQTFTKEFLQSYKYQNQSREFLSDLDDDEKDKYESDVLSSSTTLTNQEKISSKKFQIDDKSNSIHDIYSDIDNVSEQTSRSLTPVRISSYDTKPSFDNGKGNSLLTGTTFDVLMNNLKTIREKDLDDLIHQSDESLVH